MTVRVAVRPLEDPMPLRSSLKKLPGTSLSRWTGAAAVIGLFAVSAGGCSGCGDSSVTCEPDGQHCLICDGYGCHSADVDVIGGGGAGGATTGGGGAPQACDQTETACPCEANDQCAEGLSCVSGVCIAGCTFSYECGPGNVCINGGCAPGCDAQTGCADGYTCSKGACVPDPNNPECSPEVPCESGEICASGVCTTACSANTDCSPGTICDGTTHACIPDPSPKPLCSDTIKCTGPGQVCLPDGYCHYPCESVEICKKIDSRFVACDAGICKTIEEFSPECTIDKPCKDGQDCVSNRCL
jgi:hypothetical protein